MSELVVYPDTGQEIDEALEQEFSEEPSIECVAAENLVAIDGLYRTHAGTREFSLLSSAEEIALTRIRPMYRPTYRKILTWTDGPDTLSVRTFIKESAQKGLLLPAEEGVLGRLVHRGTAAATRLEIDEYDEEGTFLIDQQLVQGGKRAAEIMRDCNQLLTIKYARAHHDAFRKVGVMDFIQEGVGGIEHAIRKFDPDKGYKFSTYAVPWIRQYMQRYAQKAAREIKAPLNLYVKDGKYKRYEEKRDKWESDAEAAKDLKLTPEQQEDFRAAYATRSTASFDRKSRQPGAEDITLYHRVADSQAEAAFEEILADDPEEKEELGPVYDALTKAFAPAEVWAFMMASDGQSLNDTDAARVLRVKASLKHPAVQSTLNDAMDMENPWSGVACADDPRKVLKSKEKRIKEICAACPLLEACEAVVMEEKPKSGMWAGMSRTAKSYHPDGRPKKLQELETV